VYHEMLHLKHPVRLRGSRRCVHSAEFQAEEKLFPQLGRAEEFFEEAVIADAIFCVPLRLRDGAAVDDRTSAGVLGGAFRVAPS